MNTYVAPDELEGIKVLKETYQESKLGIVYKGVVKNNKDPMNLGRIQVMIPTFYSGMSESSLPWAQPCLFSASYESGSFIIPRVGNIVWVLFENNDKFRPVYIGSMYTSDLSDRTRRQGERVQSARTAAVPTEATSEEIEVLYKSENSGIIYFDRDKLHILSPQGNGIEVDDSRLSFVNVEGASFNIENNVLELEFGNTKIKLDGEKISIKASSSDIEITSSSIKANTPKGSINIDETIKVSSGNCSVNVGNNTVESSVGGTKVKQSGSVVDINATTVNINASYINMR